MAQLPKHLQLSAELESKLEAIRVQARIRHELARKACRARGRVDFPLLPYECSWAYEQEFFRKHCTHR